MSRREAQRARDSFMDVTAQYADFLNMPSGARTKEYPEGRPPSGLVKTLHAPDEEPTNAFKRAEHLWAPELKVKVRNPAFIEEACAFAVGSFLPPGTLSVGTHQLQTFIDDPVFGEEDFTISFTVVPC